MTPPYGTHRFDKIERRVVKRGPCPVCRRYVQRSTVFMQTLNPFNRNGAGQIKTRPEIKAELERDAREWEPDFTHEKCRRSQA